MLTQINLQGLYLCIKLLYLFDSGDMGASVVAAPEVISNKKHYDGVMADVWSSGVMLYVMLFGQYPFERPEDKKEANR